MEMFEQLMVAAQQAGEGAFWLVVLFFTKEIILQGLWVGFWFFAIAGAFRFLRDVFGDENNLRELRNAAGIGRPGPYTQAEHADLVHWIEEQRK